MPTDYQQAGDAVRIAHQMATQAAMVRQSKHNENLRQAVNKEAVPGLDSVDDMAQTLSIDSPTTNNITNNYGTEPKAVANTEPKREKKRLGTLAMLAIGAGLIGTGAAVVPGIGLVLDAFKNEKPAVFVPVKNDALKYSLDLGD